MRRLLAFLGLLGCLSLAACGTPALGADPTPVPLPTPTPTINVGPTKTRVAELAVLATAQAPTPTSAPIVVVVATPTPDRGPNTYLPQAKPIYNNALTYLSVVVQVCGTPVEQCATTSSTSLKVIAEANNALLDLSVPKPCARMQEAYTDFTDKALSYVFAVGLAAQVFPKQADFNRETKGLLDPVTASKKAVEYETKSGTCQVQP